MRLMKKTVLYSLVFYSAVIAPFADAREISYRYFFHEQMTAQEACDRAKREIKRQALSRELGEVLQSQSFQQCTDREGQMNRCDTYTDVLAMTELGFVKSFEVLERDLQVLPTGQACFVKADVQVEQFVGKPDPDFHVSGTILPGPVLRDGDPIQLDIQAPDQSYLFVFAGRDGGDFALLDARVFSKQSGSIIPNEASPFEWMAENNALVESGERFWVVASKEKRVFPEQLTESELFQQLNRADRATWDAHLIGFRVLPKGQKGE